MIQDMQYLSHIGNKNFIKVSELEANVMSESNVITNFFKDSEFRTFKCLEINCKLSFKRNS